MRLIGLIALVGSCCLLGLPSYAQKQGQDRGGVQVQPLAPQAPTKDRPAFTRTPGQNFNIDLDTMDNRASQWAHKDLSSLSAMKASLTVARLGAPGKYPPYFTIRVETADGSLFGIRLKSNPAKAGELMAQAYTRKKEQQDETIVGAYPAVVAVDKALDVMLAWKDEMLTAWIEQQAVDLKLPGPPTVMYISSSSGEIMGDVELGQ